MSLRVALVSLKLGRLAGVDGSIAGLARAARKHALPLDVITISAEGADVDPNVQARRFEVPAPGRLARLVRFHAIASAFREGEYDVAFIRYPCAIDLDPLALLRRAPARAVATVHHSKEVEEISSGGSLGMRARALLERIQGPRLLRRLAGIVGVTEEIRAYEVARAQRAVTSAAISNGVDVDAIPHSRFRAFDGHTLRVAFVASSLAPWHGWERLRQGLTRHRGAMRVVVDAIGAIGGAAGSTEHLGQAEIRYHGMLDRPGLTRVLDEANVAVSSLGMHRIGLAEGCVLKTREYTARGLPFVYGYRDSDLHGDEPFALRLPATDDPVSIEELLAFASNVAARPELADEARAHARAKMDWSIKAKAFLHFAEELARVQN